MHLLGFHISFPAIRLEQGAHHVMCRAVHAWQASAIHEWMDTGYFGLHDGYAAGWLLASWQWELERLPPWHSVSVLLQPTFRVLRSIPRHVAFVTDGSWFPSHHFAVVCLETLTWVVTCHLDHSYAVEVHTSWVLCRVKSTLLASTHVACATSCNLREGGNFIYSKSFIMALHSRCLSELSTGLVDLLLAECIDQATPFPPP